MHTFTRRLLWVVVAVVTVLALAVAGLLLFVLIAWDRPSTRAVVSMTAASDAATRARGKYLYEQSLLCWDCHGGRGSLGPNEPQSGGREFDMRKIGPGFGFVYGSNLTPDRETGIGDWSDGELVRAIREGLSRGGRLIFPVMAYQFYHGLSDSDALAVVSYLRSLQPARNKVPPRRLSLIAKALFAIGLIHPEDAITLPVHAPAQDATVEYGEYVAWRTSGCAECHSSRDPKTAAVDRSRPMAGGLFPFPESGFVTTGANLTPDEATGIGRWTEEQFVTAMRTGVRPNGTVMLPFMPWPYYSGWSDAELHAVWLYLRSIKPVSHAVPPSQLIGAAQTASGPARGAALYATYCRECHGERGAGSPLVTPRLREASLQLDEESIAGFISEGVPSTSMPGFGKTLSKEQIADIVRFVRGW